MSQLSARAPVGASARAELFSGRSHSGNVGVPMPAAPGAPAAREEIPPSTRDRLQGDYGVGAQEDDPLQLEHMLGYSGDYRRTALALPNRDNIFVKSMGSLISIQNLADPHDQRLLRGHDMPITVLAVSSTGTYVASGQIGTKHFRGDAAPVFVWSTITGARVAVLKGISQRVTLLSFSTDEKFVCGTGEDLLLYIWDVSTGEVVYGRRLNTKLSVLKFIDHARVGHYVSYQLALGLDSFLHRGVFSYDPNKVQWQLETEKFSLPPGGNLVREFTCIDNSADNEFLYVGTAGGEMLVLMRRTNVFRAIIPICTNSLTSICVLDNEDVICGGGDGTLHRLNGRDMAWRVVMQATMDSHINTISLTASRSEILVVCSSGTVFRCLVDNFGTNSVVSEGHTSAVRCISFAPNSTVFVTGTASGEMRSWDVIDYACQAVLRIPKSGAVMSLYVVDQNYVLSGWEDGFIRCHDLATLSRQMWYVPNAHRGGVRSLCAHIGPTMRYFLSGGGEGSVRVWKLDTRELITQHSEHSKAVSKVLVDNRQPNIIHSVGVDCSVLSFDLKTNARKMGHLSTGCITDMSQRIDSEQEIVTCDTSGRLLFWDIDYRDAVLSMQDPSRTAIRACCVSPSGQYLAFSGDDQLLKVLELTSGRILSLGQGHSSTVNALSWTTDERQIVTCGEDMTLCIWNFYLGGVASAGAV